LLAGRTVFGGNFDRIAFALDAANNSEATKSLAAMVAAGQLTGEAEKNAWMTIANLGGSKELEMVLNRAASRSDAGLLKALADAPSTNTAAPEDAGALKELLLHDSAEIRTLALQLLGRWEIPVEGELLVAQMKKSGATLREQLAAADALVGLGEWDLLKQVATIEPNSGVRHAAIATWAKSDPAAAAKIAVKSLTETHSASQARLIIGAYCGLNKGPEILRENLAGKSIPEEVALAGIRVAQASGRDMSGLIAELTRAGSLKPIGASLSPAQRKELLSEMSKSGNASRGREIFLRPAQICATCHAINGTGGKVGPDLSTVGAYMTPESLLESLLNPSTSIKQGYETVVITKKDETVVSGTLDRKTGQGAQVRDAVGNMVFVPNEEIDKLDVSQVSLMPPGLTSSLRQDELADLMKYLTSLGKGK
jgi:putative heme-binding domain-containing protein